MNEPNAIFKKKVRRPAPVTEPAVLPGTELSESSKALPESFNYIGLFLTFRCPYKCSFCINRSEGNRLSDYREINGREWLGFLETLQSGGVPVTLQGGEPGLHRDFIEIVKTASQWMHIDILTNLAFDIDRFIAEVEPARLNREAPYAPIRVSYHPAQFSLEHITSRVLKMQNAGFRIGLYGVLHPSQLAEIKRASRVCAGLGIDFREKPFLGLYRGKLYGEYAYQDACAGTPFARCECAGTELLIAPDGAMHRCHKFLYSHMRPIADISAPGAALREKFRLCNQYGACNPCDVKLKNNRFQRFGHVSMKIRDIRQFRTPTV